MRPHLSSFLNHVAERTGKAVVGSGDILETFFPADDATQPTTPEHDKFLLSLYAAVTSLPKPGRSFLLWVKWGHDDEGNFPPLSPEPDTEPTYTHRLNQSWELIQYKSRTEIAPRGGGSGGAGNVVFWYAPPNPTLTYAFDGPQAGSPESYGFTS